MISHFNFAPRLALVTALALSACAPEPEPVRPSDPNIDVTPGLNDKEPDTCHAVQFGYLVGQPESALTTAGITNTYRVVTPESIITQEYNSQRIDVLVDEQGIITKISCG